MKDQLGGFHYADCTDKCLWWTDSAPRGYRDDLPRGVSSCCCCNIARLAAAAQWDSHSVLISSSDAQ